MFTAMLLTGPQTTWMFLSRQCSLTRTMWLNTISAPSTASIGRGSWFRSATSFIATSSWQTLLVTLLLLFVQQGLVATSHVSRILIILITFDHFTLAGCVARNMGVPVNLVAAVTPNDIVHRTFKNGDFSLSEKVLQTWATAMDIQVPYNVERIMLIAAGLDTNRVAKLMTEFERETKTMIPGDLLKKMQEIIVDTLMVEDEEMVSTMRRVFEENDKSYCICPHTAVGVAYFYKNSSVFPQVGLSLL